MMGSVSTLCTKSKIEKVHFKQASPRKIFHVFKHFIPNLDYFVRLCYMNSPN